MSYIIGHNYLMARWTRKCITCIPLRTSRCIEEEGNFTRDHSYFLFVHVPSCLENPHTLFCEIVLWSTNSEKFPDIFEVADSNLYIFGKITWYTVYVYIQYSKVETYIVRTITYYISLNQLLPNILRNFSELVLTMYEVHRGMCQDLYP